MEDALRDRKGHWLEAVTTFYHGLQVLGDKVTVLADAALPPDLREPLAAVPILPASIWHRLGDGAGPVTRYSRVFVHAWQTWQVMSRYLRENEAFDAIFVPTVGLHHLIAWVWLIKRILRERPARILLFFIHAPLRYNSATGRVVQDGSPTSKAIRLLLRSISSEVNAGKVVLGVETRAMQIAMQELTGIRFVQFPIAVAKSENPQRNTSATSGGMEMACFGPARAEKGSEVLQEAISIHRRKYPKSPLRFTLHWIDDFLVNGKVISKASQLLRDPQVNYLTHYLNDKEYAAQIARTHVMLLPYRLGSYAFRGSKVAAEASVYGIPAVITKATSLAEVIDRFGSGLICEDGNAESLAACIRQMELRFAEFSRKAEVRQPAAKQFFSVAHFRSIFWAPQNSMMCASAGVGKVQVLQV